MDPPPPSSPVPPSAGGSSSPSPTSAPQLTFIQFAPPLSPQARAAAAAASPPAFHPPPNVPQRVYAPHHPGDQERHVHQAALQPPVLFHDRYGEGIRLADLLASSGSGPGGSGGGAATPGAEAAGPSTSTRVQTPPPLALWGADEKVLEHVDASTATLRIWWPGHVDSWSEAFVVKNWKKRRSALTRAELGRRTAQRVKLFIDHTTEHPPPRDETSEELCRWWIGPDGIRFQDLLLVQLEHVSRGTFQPVLRASRRDDTHPVSVELSSLPASLRDLIHPDPV